ncbi:LSU ribosomal protein L15P [Alkalispirochaeta americana]|uniref:Large ribosomal subunit protein uL15 n=1 Tax=Alkalispirochaeta americana TaxID=159291 RepID=A0A1N6NI79_9SPIO|nr:50S ribosomal protein L15 [Alkalispirochaeta americana]SIP91805.1 LSU ribosomal protein L15P [Alkalispirochaeta americana]
MNMIRVPAGAVRNRKRLGRGIGSGLGKTSGKGHNGQNARSGGGVRPGFEGGQMPLYRRIARRGFSNYRFKVEYHPINLDVLCQSFESGAVVSLEVLKERRMVGKNVKFVKILARGECSHPLTVQGLAISAGAKAKIEAAGGSVVEAVRDTGSEG